jgi:hypothetical protein
MSLVTSPGFSCLQTSMLPVTFPTVANHGVAHTEAGKGKVMWRMHGVMIILSSNSGCILQLRVRELHLLHILLAEDAYFDILEWPSRCLSSAM